MASYLALLRGINVGGHNKVLMSDLTEVFVGLGVGDVRTHLQTGNVLFSAMRHVPDPGEIEFAIARDLGVSTRVVLRSRDEMLAVCRNSPFSEPWADPGKFYVAFLGSEPEPLRASSFSVPHPGRERAWISQRQIYLYYPDDYARSKLTNSYIEKQLAVAATTRNWRVTSQLAMLLDETPPTDADR